MAMIVAIIGGTGSMGFGLATRLAAGGTAVFIGSRDAARAQEAAARVREAIAGTEGGLPPTGLANGEAAARADVVVLTVPPPAQVRALAELAQVLKGKVVIDATVSTAEGDPTRVVMPPEGASAVRARAVLGPETRLVAGFHTVSGRLLSRLDRPLDCDILLTGDDVEAKAAAAEIARRIGARPVDVGPLENAGTLERLTAMIIGMNIRLKRRHIGIRFTGL